jgi:hypothetical protein
MFTQEQITDAAMTLLDLSGPGNTVLFLMQWVASNLDEIRAAGPTLIQQARYAADGFSLQPRPGVSP